MSMSGYNTSFLASSVKLKQFVRESLTSPESDKPDKTQLNFHGEEAKIAYESIVNRETDKNPRNRKSVSARLKTANPERQGNKNKNKNRGSKKHNKITANSILKAVEAGDIEYLELNVTQLNVNICDDYGWTPLMSAAFCGNYKIIDFLLKLGADTKCRDKSGFTAAGLASKKNYSGIVALLREKQSIDNLGTTNNQSLKKDAKTSHRKSRFYCSICRESFKETTVEKHEASTLHIFNTKPKLPGGMYAISKQNRGYRIMLNGGWGEEGLGPKGKGLKYPIKTVLKRDRKGLGLEKKDTARVTHFNREDAKAVERIQRQPKEKTLRKAERDEMLSRESRRQRAIRRALS